MTAATEVPAAPGRNPEPSAATPAKRSRAGAEAARYGVLRRLGPALKHDMVVNLQAIAMMAEVMNAKLDRGSPDPAEFHASIAKLNRLARDAVANCLKVAAWLVPGEDEGIKLGDGVDECVALLASNFNFRGFLVEADSAETPFQVSRVVLRNLLIASLITLTDAATAPSRVEVKAEVDGQTALVTVRVSPRDDEFEGLPYEPGYRQLDWSDVQALAVAEGVDLIRGDDHISLRLPRHLATAPLQIAPH
jgi:C4-dicarboxylate-specific signal transduction histidine kinase